MSCKALPLLSLLVWLPILGGALCLMVGNARPQRRAGWRWPSRCSTLALSIPLFTGFDMANAGMQFVEQHAWIPAYDIRYHLGADGISVRADRADDADHGAGADRRVGRDRQARQPVLRVAADPRRRDDRRVRGDGRDAVLRVLRGHADPDVHHHRRLGRPAPRLRVGEVLPVHLPRLGVHAGRADLPVPEGRQLAARRHGPRCRCRCPSRCGCSSRS